ncbi:DUF6888 family protein [Microcoleus vaginatus]|uniref:DUF6888 family protein n=1 Tax=Microcoleus vaginatus TaxID=119532 RepID=UPI00020D10EA|nr:hypothetical protein MicvaDRAFT_1328 [Microcoleus vaginatus FGP-2]
MPTYLVLEGLYRITYYLTYLALPPIHLVCVDNSKNLFVLARYEEEIEIKIAPNGEVF